MARIGQNMDRSELAQLLDVSLRTVANWEKNGVPQHRVALVMTKMGLSVRAAQESLEFGEWRKTPAGQQALEEDYERLVANGDIEPAVSSGRGFRRPLKELLSPYSTVALLDEVNRRVRNMESALEGLEVDGSSDDDPDYSEMSEQDAKDYGLAAKKADKHIGHDELPHEP